MRFTGKVALITGGSSGIGVATTMSPRSRRWPHPYRIRSIGFRDYARVNLQSRWHKPYPFPPLPPPP
jgi:hypothetical protein